MKRNILKSFSRMMAIAALIAIGGCAKFMPPARAIPPGDENTQLCKEKYLDCRGQCASTKHKDTRLNCAEQCERDVDTCLLQSRERKE